MLEVPEDLDLELGKAWAGHSVALAAVSWGSKGPFSPFFQVSAPGEQDTGLAGCCLQPSSRVNAFMNLVKNKDGFHASTLHSLNLHSPFSPTPQGNVMPT